MRRGPRLNFGRGAAVSAVAAAADSIKEKFGADARSCYGEPTNSSGTEGGSATSAEGDSGGGGGGGRAWKGGTRAKLEKRAWGEGLSKSSRGGGGRGRERSGGGAVWSQVRGADLETWTKLAQQYGTTLGGTFAANALFRAAHFVDGAGALLIVANESGTPAPTATHSAAALPPMLPPSGADAAAFAALVQQLLGPITEAAVAGQLDGVRCSRLLWALAKLSGDGSWVAAPNRMEARAEGDRAGLQQEQHRTQDWYQEPSGAEGYVSMPDRQGQAAMGREKGDVRGPALPLSIMKEQGARCAATLAVLLLRQLATGGGPDGAPDAHVGSNLHGPLCRSSGGVVKAGAGPGGGDGGASLSGRLLVMAMWGLARLTAAGHMRYIAAEPAVRGATAADSGASGSVASCAVNQNELWEGLCEALRPRVAELQARELSNAMWALASVRRCHHAVFEDLMTALEQHLEIAAEVGEAAAAAAEIAPARSRLQRQTGKPAITGCNAQVGVLP
ncbi:hypothetical protein Vafri_7424 [Volvox africanus]|uniref:Uncharacterized protein n=1 Tax=Volvox africanus TaxID=51714 RepID=A0A8J4B4T3_9CHLO|nr:hypothetical protein Vafri_7424 [Volvox africanus]